MANISDVYNISFISSTKGLAKALYRYLKEAEKNNAYYQTTEDAQLDNYNISSQCVGGRWAYISNLEGTFLDPQTWFGEESWARTEQLYNKVISHLKNGQIITISWSEEEPGCMLFQDASLEITWGEDGILMDYYAEEKEPPADRCQDCYEPLENECECDNEDK